MTCIMHVSHKSFMLVLIPVQHLYELFRRHATHKVLLHHPLVLEDHDVELGCQAFFRETAAKRRLNIVDTASRQSTHLHGNQFP
jgi:hypothetical protein